MKKEKNEFWDNLRQVAQADNSVPVPIESVNKALAIFQPIREKRFSNVLSLRPSFAGAVRRAGVAEKLLYELNTDYIVQLEKTWDETGYHLSGFVHGFDDAPVVLYGNESVHEASIEAGNFELKGIPSGTYTMSFTHGGEDYWITNLALETENP